MIWFLHGNIVRGKKSETQFLIFMATRNKGHTEKGFSRFDSIFLILNFIFLEKCGQNFFQIHQPFKSLLNLYLKECKSAFSRDNCTPISIAALITIVRLWNQSRCPSTDEWIKVFIHNGVLFNHKEE
jgi:hypothetical protein